MLLSGTRMRNCCPSDTPSRKKLVRARIERFPLLDLTPNYKDDVETIREAFEHRELGPAGNLPLVCERIEK